MRAQADWDSVILVQGILLDRIYWVRVVASVLGAAKAVCLFGSGGGLSLWNVTSSETLHKEALIVHTFTQIDVLLRLNPLSTKFIHMCSY